MSPSASYRFLRYFALSGSYTYSRNEFDDSAGGAVPTTRFNELAASLSLTLRPGLPRFSVDYTFSSNDSDNDDDDFDREVLLFTVSYSFPVGL